MIINETIFFFTKSKSRAKTASGDFVFSFWRRLMSVGCVCHSIENIIKCLNSYAMISQYIFYYLLSLSQVLPQFVFNSRDPIVMGVMVEAGIVKEGTPICVPSKSVSNFCNFSTLLIKK